MDTNKNPFAFLNNADQTMNTKGGGEFDFLRAQDKIPRALNADDLGLLAKEEGAAHLMPVINAIYGQESGAGANSKTSTDGAIGGMQVMPDTFRRFAKQGESIDNPADNMRVGMRIIKSLGDKFGNDPAKIATGYFSGEGNVNAGSGSAWKNDHKDGNGKRVSGYVADVLGRLSPIKEAKAEESLPDLSQFPKWSEISTSERYISLSDTEKTKLKGAYFDDVLAPHAGTEAPKAREQFMAQRDTAPGFDEKLNAKMAGVVPEVKRIFGVGSVMDGYDPNSKNQTGVNLQEAMPNSQTLRDVDGSVENRQARLERLGINKGLAGRLAKEGAANGVLPGEEVKGIDMLAVPPAKNSVGDVATGLASGLKEDFAQAAGTGIRGVGNFLSEEAIGNKDLSALGAQIEKFGADIYRNSKKREGKNQPTFESETGQGLYSGARSLSQLLTYFAATGGNPTAALGLMVGQTGAQGAGEALEKGKDFFTAGSYGAGQAALEYATEKMPMGYLAKHLGKEGFKQFVGGFLLRELPSEQVATLTQDALQKAILEPEKTWAEYAKERPGAAYQTLLATGVMAGGMGALNKGSSMLDEYQANQTKQKALDRWNQGLLGVPRADVQAVQTPDGRIEPMTAPTTAPNVAAAEPTPVDVHPTSAVADSIVADLANQEGIPQEFVLPQQKSKQPNEGAENITDQDALDFAETRYRQLVAKRDGIIQQVPTNAGMMDQEVPGQALTPQEAAELAVLETQNPVEIRSFYGMAQTVPSDQSALQTQGQTPAPAAAPVEQPAQGTIIPEATEPGMVAAQAPVPVAPAAPDNDATGLASMGSGIAGAIADNGYKGLFDALSKGKSTMSGVKDPVLARAKPYFDAGLIRNKDDLRKFENEGYPELSKAQEKTPEIKPLVDATITKEETKPAEPAEAIDVSGRTDQQLTYLAENGLPGWKEAAIAELAKRGIGQEPTGPQGQFKTAEEAQAYISAQRRASSAKLPKALPLPHADGSFGVVTEGHAGWEQAVAYAKANAPKTEKEAKAKRDKTGARTATIEHGEDGRITLLMRDADGTELSPMYFDDIAQAQRERINWERGTSSTETPLATQESDIDAAATAGFSDAQSGKEKRPGSELNDVQSQAYSIGYRRGIEELSGKTPKTEKEAKAKRAADAAIDKKTDEVMALAKEATHDSFKPTREQVRQLIVEKGIDAADKTISGLKKSIQDAKKRAAYAKPKAEQAVAPDVVAKQPSEFSGRWDAMSPEEREAIAKSAGWITSKNTLNPTGKQIVKRVSADIPEGTMATLERFATQQEKTNGTEAEKTVTPESGQQAEVPVSGQESVTSAYTTPEDIWGDWLGSERSDYTPNSRQKMVMDSVRKALDSGLFYNDAVRDFVAKDIGATDDQLKSNKSNVQGGDFGYDVYYARKAIEAASNNALEKQIREELNLQAGDKLGTLIFNNDFKVNTNVVVKSVSDDGKSVELEGKRGAYTVTVKSNPAAVRYGIERAKERGKRKDTYEEFIATRNKPKTEKDAKAKREAAIAAPREMTEEGRAKDGRPINGGDVFLTSSGRTTTPYPKQKQEIYASQWLIDNAVAEAESRGDSFNATPFKATKPGKNGSLTMADRDGMLMYVFGEQPKVVPSITKPLVAKTEQSPAAKSPKAVKTEKSVKADKARKELESFYTPGNIIYLDYWKQHDRVLAFNWNDGNWNVKVEHVEKKGDEWVAVDQPRAHSTAPGKDQVIERAPEAKAEHTPDNVQNFGKELEGGRRNRAPSLDKELSEHEIAGQPLSKIWPADEIDGIEDKFAAAVAFAARAEIPAKPRVSHRVANWAQKVQILRQLAAGIVRVGNDKARDVFAQAMKGSIHFRAKVALLEAVDRDQWSRIGNVYEYPNSYRYDESGAKIPTAFVSVEIDGKNNRFDGTKSVSEVIEQVNVLLGKEAEDKKMAFEVRGRTGSYSINKKGDKEYRKLKTFTDSKEAFAYIKDNYADLVAAWDAVKERDNVGKGDVRNAENRPRTGKDWLEGKDVTAQQFIDDLGFRGVEFGKWVGQGTGAKERQGMLNQAYEALMDLATIIGVPPKAISLNGSMGLAFGSRGSGNASAHFEPGNLVINLTKTKGAGSLAHEWFHALDNYFARMRGGEKTMKEVGSQDEYRRQNYVTYKPEPLMVHKSQRSSPLTKARLEQIHQESPKSQYFNPENWQVDPKHPEGVRPVVEKAFADLVEALDKSPMTLRAKRNDKGKDGYWGRIIERAARSFENYVIHKMDQDGYQNDYLANVTSAEDFQRDADRYPYLRPEEVKPVADAFDQLFKTVETKKTEDDHVTMFSRSKAKAPNQWYQSQLETAIDQAPDRVFGKAAQFKLWLASNAAKLGIKKDEIEWSGINEFLDLRQGSNVSKQEILDFLSSNSVKVQDVIKGIDDSDVEAWWNDEGGANEETPFEDLSAEERRDAIERYRDEVGQYSEDSEDTKYSRYVQPGGENYKELLLTLPVNGVQNVVSATSDGDNWTVKFSDGRKEVFPERKANDKDEAIAYATRDRNYQSIHWDEKNILAHVRFNDRTDADGNKVLFIEELQSDWAQDGRKKGFRNPKYQEAKESFQKWMQENPTTSAAVWREQNPDLVGISDAGIQNAPFVKDTKAWVALSIKRMIAYAAENGYDKVAFVNGGQSAERYDLSKQIKSVFAEKIGEDEYRLTVTPKDKSPYWAGDMTSDRLEATVGKDLAKKIVSDGGGEYSGLDLSVGGEGMKSFYDKIVPQVANDVLKKLGGGKVSEVKLSGTSTYEQLVEAAKKTGRTQAELDAMPVDERKSLIDSVLPAQLGFDITPAMREKVAAGLPLFSRGKSGSGMAVRDLKAVVDRARASLTNLPQVHVMKSPDSLDRNDPSQSRLFDRIKESGAENDVEGATHDGEIYLFADNLADEFRAEHVLVNHEVGHYGLREVFGKNGLDPILNTIYMTNAKVRKQADALRERLDLASNAEATEEVLVEMEPKELIKLNAWRRLVRYVRDWLNDHGFGKMAGRLNGLLKAGMTEQQKADVLVADVINAARDWVRNGSPSQSSTIEETKLSAGKANDTSFKNWFENSKIVDKSGRPSIVYHMADSEITEFKPKSYGTAGEHSYFYFAASKAWSEKFAKDELKGAVAKLHRAHLSIKNPMDLRVGAKKPAEWKTFFDERGVKVSPVFVGKLNSAAQGVEIAAWQLIRYDTPQNGALRESLIAAGYDGLILSDVIRGKMDNTTYVAFSPEQIKPANDVNWQNSPENSDVRYSRKTDQLPDVLILADLGSAKAHPDHDAAKAGDVEAAANVVKSIITPEAIAKIKAAIDGEQPIVVPVVAKESAGHNQIPMVAATMIGAELGLDVSTSIYQSSASKRTSMDGLSRIFGSPSFDGHVDPGKTYLLVDDTVTQGATFAELTGFIQERGGKVIANVALTGKQYSAKLQITEETLGKLREKFGDIEDQFEAATGHGFGTLTESEARYLSSYKPADEIRSRILAEGRQSGTPEGSEDSGVRLSRKPVSQVVRDLQSNVVQFYGNQDLKTFNGLNRTINTQFHKALKDKDFGRVYNLIQSMQNHVATASSRPAELAPGILHRVDNVGQAIKTLVSKSQRQAIEKAGEALFAGTLSGNSVLDGRVWSEAELREKFGLDDAGVALYKQARQAIDASLMELAAAEAYAIAETYLPKALRADIIESPDDAEALIMAALGRQIDMARTANLDDETQASMADAREKAKAIFEQAEKLKKAGYAPLMRFGKYDLKVMAIDPATGNLERDENDNPVTLYYGRFESQGKLRDMERQLRARYADKLDEIRIIPGVVNENANELYRGVNPETMSIFAEAIGASQAMDDYIRLVRSERSAMKRRLERKGTAGYSTDVQRVLANFITSNARQSAQQLFGTAVNRAIRRIPREKGDVQKEALQLRDYVINPNDNGALGSSLMFAWFLGGSPAAALVNMTQPVMMTLPFLSQYGATKAAAELTKAVPYAMGGKEITDRDLRQAMKKASLEGIVDAQEVFHLYAIGSRQLSAGPRSQAAMMLWGSMFSAVEGANRRLTFIAAWNIAVSQGNKDPYGFAVNAVNQTQGIYNKANRPNWARSSVGRAVFTFKTYGIMYVELMNRMWKSGPEGKKAVLLMMAVLILAAGIEGLPGAKALDDLIDTIGQWMGYDTNMKRWKRRHAYELLGKVAGDLVLYGASSLTPLDFGGRLGLGNIIPGTDILKPSSGLGNYGRALGELVGPTAGAAQQIGDAAEALEAGNYGQAAKNLLPKAGRDFASAIDMGMRGYARDMAGRKTVETSGTDAVIKGVGFNPTVVAEKTRAAMPVQQDIQLVKKKEANIVHAWAQAVVDNDQAEANAQAKKLADWNRDNPDNPIRITPDQIRNKAKALSTDKGSRIAKTAPKEIRGRIGLELLKK